MSDAGFIFFVSHATQDECLLSGLGGLPAGLRALAESVARGSAVFVYNTSSKVMHGPFEAERNGGWQLQPRAFDGHFPAQVMFRVRRGRVAVALRLAAVSHALNFFAGNKFSQRLTAQQARVCLRLPFSLPPADDASAHRWLRYMRHSMTQAPSRTAPSATARARRRASRASSNALRQAMRRPRCAPSPLSGPAAARGASAPCCRHPSGRPRERSVRPRRRPAQTVTAERGRVSPTARRSASQSRSGSRRRTRWRR